MSGCFARSTFLSRWAASTQCEPAPHAESQTRAKARRGALYSPLIDWLDTTVTQLLDTYTELTPLQAAHALGFVRRDGAPNHRRVIDLVRAGRLTVIDASLPSKDWTIPSIAVRVYLDRPPGFGPVCFPPTFQRK